MEGEWPRDNEGREQMRSEWLEFHTLKGVRKGLYYGLSMRCERGDHGCMNDGSTCLCRCHDRRTP